MVPEHIMDEPLIHNMLRTFAGLTPFLNATTSMNAVGLFLPLFHQAMSVGGVPGVTSSFLNKPPL